ncbi:DUF7331 family protein [Natronocalculus amylovorans]|uniref:Uncharacterized protein n=1 Tax=Natronocalculus amylovorans TaxID=2917812 RepID=A0AAE3FTQ1_9EURY|nr:hypothetical protein [Natronocalculus amylovorans]MCL9815417.1 hypothetical protein [Natronocalculus amylovorans]
MTTRANDTELDRADGLPALPEGNATVETYDVENGVVFYDAENPLAWLESSHAFSLQDCT